MINSATQCKLYLAHVQDVVDVLQKAFVLQLCVTEQEDSGLAIRPSLAQHRAQVLPPLIHPIALADLNGEEGTLCHEGCNASEALPATAAHTHLGARSDHIITFFSGFEVGVKPAEACSHGCTDGQHKRCAMARQALKSSG